MRQSGRFGGAVLGRDFDSTAAPPTSAPGCARYATNASTMMYGPRGSLTSSEFPWVPQMAQVPETLSMDRHGVTFVKRKQLTVSKNLAILILLTVVICIIITGVLTYFLTSRLDDGHCDESALKQQLQKKEEEEDGSSESSSGTSAHRPTTESAHPETSTLPDEATPVNLRLPTSVLPIDYDLRILTIMSNFTFAGSVRIRVNVKEPTFNITMHANDLNISEPHVGQEQLNGEGHTEVPIVEWAILTEPQFLVIYFEQALLAGEYNFTVRFAGVLKDELAGYYRSSYKTGNQTRWLAATQFEATDARRAFPCFDEPAMKATFRITIGRPKHLMAISNMPKVSSHPHPELKGYVWDTFQRSLPMSTYLVAFIVSDFKSKHVGNFSLYARESALSQTEEAVSLGPKFLKFYESFFNVPFPLPKMDLAAIPDFSAGAMENWGLITFRESNLLYQEGVSTKHNLQRIAIVIAHELGHQWFGNLVTPEWWTDLWLNEGFATFLENIATAAVFPKWKLMDQFVVHDLQAAFKLDALMSSHPISVPVNNPTEINDIFDEISYNKGASIIRMMENFLSNGCFRSGLTNYLNENKYSNAHQDDLWSALTEQAHTDGILTPDMSVKDVMDSWTLQMGFPVITVQRSDSGAVTVTQNKFMLNANDTAGADFQWWVPLSFEDASGNKGFMWLPKDREMTLQTIKVDTNDWILFNLNQTGYYRVNYDRKGWRMIEKQLKRDHAVFDPKNRAQIMDDALSLARSGYADYKLVLNLTTYLRSEEDYVPIQAALANLKYLFLMFQRSGHYDVFRNYLRSIVMPLFKKVGFQDNPKDPLLVSYLRSAIVERACVMEARECVDRAMTDFHNWMMSPEPDTINAISPNLKMTVYCTAVKIGGEPMWNFAFQRYLNANVGTERDLLLSALGCTQEVWLLNKYLSLAFDPTSGIKKQDVISVFRAISSSIVGQTIGFRYAISNWDDINTYLGKSIMTTSGILSTISQGMNTIKELQDIKIFSEQHADDETLSKRTVNQIIEQTEANNDWMQTHYPTVLEWLHEYHHQ